MNVNGLPKLYLHILAYPVDMNYLFLISGLELLWVQVSVGWNENIIYISRVTYLGPHTILLAHEPDLTIPRAYVSALVITDCQRSLITFMLYA